MKLQFFSLPFAVCQLRDLSQLDVSSDYLFLSKTEEELSMVCPQAVVPKNYTICENGFRLFRIAGCLDFSLTGILAGIAGILAEHQIPLFAVSTYNTDYFLVKEEYLAKAMDCLAVAGYEIESRMDSFVPS